MITSVAPTIGLTGISAPTFADILAFLTAQYQAIFGADTYLGNDSQDGQFLAIIAQAIADSNASAIAAYNAFSPLTAQGTGLSSVVKINGLSRLPPSYSIASVTVSGVFGTVIANGQVGDANGNTWNLPVSVTIPSTSSIVVTATCATSGAIAAGMGTITKILTPVYGWQGVTNASAASAGTATETDAALRIRQGQSVAIPSQTIFAGIWAAIEAVSSVTRVEGYENNTNAANANGVPAHNLAFVVEGGAQADIVNALGLKTPPGIPTYGTTSATYTDANGASKAVAYSIVAESTVSVALTIKRLTGWTVEIETAIQNAIVAYITGLAIGQDVSFTGLYVPAYAALAQYSGAYEITAMTVNSGTADIVISWNAAATTVATDITFTLV